MLRVIRPLKCAVVTDDPTWISSVERLLRTHNSHCDAVGFLDPLAALDFCLHNPVDLIVFDLLMPEVYGLFFVEAVRQFGLTMPVILVSADGLIAAEALESGANAFLSKAAVYAELARTVERLISSPQLRLEPAVTLEAPLPH